jgi:lipoyltransferase/lipoate-protein ligase
MSPSRGFNSLLRARINIAQHHVRRYSDFVRAATNPSNKTQIYISRSLDPYLNLSIEHYLLQKTPADSTVLFLYTNRPSIIIGRNQNPWVEANLNFVREEKPEIQIVRRRSGGGTVFHDEGNVNYSVICPTPAFDRDKHAQMVVRALRQLGLAGMRVNPRHDIVFYGKKFNFKVSGSAYKLTRLRSLHHGTCLLSSPNLNAIKHLLKSRTKPFVKAKGVGSVSSRITNTGVKENEAFENAVVSEFSSMYEATQPIIVTEALKDIPEITQGLEELKVSVPISMLRWRVLIEEV